MTKTLLLTVFFFCASSDLFAQSIVSRAMGFDAIQEIIRSESRQTELEISPDQLEGLARLLDSKEVKEARGESMFQRSMAVESEDVFEEDFGAPRNAPGKTKSEVIASALPTLLEESQLQAMRVSKVRQILRFPLQALEDLYLLQIGMLHNDIRTLKSNVTLTLPRADEERIRALRFSVVAALLSKFPDASRTLFAQCFGRDYLPAPMPKDSFDESSIGLFTRDRGSEFLLLAAYVLSPKVKVLAPLGAEKLTEQQGLDCSKILREISSKFFVPVPGWDPNSKADQWVAQNLTTAQRNAVVLYNHLSKLEDDLKVFLEPKVYQYLQLPNDLEASIRRDCVQGQEDINAVRLQMELKVFKLAIDALPPKAQQTARQLYDNVWCDLQLPQRAR